MPGRGTHHDFDNSISGDSVFDWGFGTSWTNIHTNTSSNSSNNSNTNIAPAATSGRVEGRESGELGLERKPSRYDPKALNRITDDIDDLIEECGSDTDSIDDAPRTSSVRTVKTGRGSTRSLETDGNSKTQYGPGGVGTALFCRRLVTIFALVATITVASLAIGYAVINHDPSKGPFSLAAITGSGGDATQEQNLLEIAERVVTACSQRELDEDSSKCKELCHSNMCCFESGEYSCENDEGKKCAVYAGCEALLDGVPVDGEEEENE